MKIILTGIFPHNNLWSHNLWFVDSILIIKSFPSLTSSWSFTNDLNTKRFFQKCSLCLFLFAKKNRMRGKIFRVPRTRTEQELKKICVFFHPRSHAWYLLNGLYIEWIQRNIIQGCFGVFRKLKWSMVISIFPSRDRRKYYVCSFNFLGNLTKLTRKPT